MARLFTGGDDDTDSGEYPLLDADDPLIEVHGYATQGAGVGYTRVRGISALLVTCPPRAGHR